MSHIRYQTTLLRVGTLCAAVLALSAQAASFDCAKATTKVEHMICANPELSKLDDEMGEKFRSALHEGVDRAKLARGQRKWLAERNGCPSAACVETAYKSRLAELSTAQKGVELRQSGGGSAQAVASNTAKSESALSEQDKVRQIMASHRFSLSLVRDKSEESFCKIFLDDFRMMKGITFLKPEMESDSYSDRTIWGQTRFNCDMMALPTSKVQ